MSKWFMKLKTPIGEESNNAKVYIICTLNNIGEEDCGYVMKVAEIDDLLNNNEVKLQNACAKKDLCLPVEDSWIVGDKQIIITRLARETLLNYINDQKDDNIIIDKIKNALFLMKELHIAGIVHCDTHLNNFMFTQDNDLKFIDLGNSVYLGSGYKNIENFFKNYLEQIIYDYELFEKNVGYISKKITQILSELIDYNIVKKLRSELIKYSKIEVKKDNIRDDEYVYSGIPIKEKIMEVSKIKDLLLSLEEDIINDFIKKDYNIY